MAFVVFMRSNFRKKGREQSRYKRDIFALPNLHNLVLARGHYRCMMPCSNLALSQSERALYRQQIKAILGIVIIILVKCKVYCC